MKRFAAIWTLLFAVGLLGAKAQQTADNQYLNIYSLIEQGDALAGSGDFRQALNDYSVAQSQLQQFKNSYPDWNPGIVTFRLKYITEKISELTAKLPSPVLIAAQTAPVSSQSTPSDDVKSANAATDSQIASLRSELAAAQSENTSLLAKLKEALSLQPAVSDTGELARAQAQIRSLMKENDLLKAGMANGHFDAGVDTNALPALRDENTQLKNQLAVLQSEAQVRQLENVALENRLKQWETNPPAPAQLDELTNQIRTLRERLAVDEARPSPYTAEELALFQQSAPQPASAPTEKKTVHKLPAGSAALVAEAQNFFNAKQYDRAEADYLKILDEDPGNLLVLGNLATIEMQQGKLDKAEKHIQAALAQDPDDAFNLSTLGYLKFQQGKYDEALDYLSRAAKLDPKSPEIQNYLGVTLSHKGLRTQAEAALRKAIELNPDYAAAHNNLAAIYISQTPPLAELARWHYEKALADGQPHNPELEKALAEKGVPVTP